MLDDIFKFIKLLKLEISFTGADVNNLIKNVSEEKTIRKLDFLNLFLKETSIDRSFSDSWKKCVSNSCLPLRNHERNKLAEIGNFLGTTDLESQLSMLTMYEEYFKNYSKEAQNEMKKSGQVSFLLGVVLGFAVFILVL